MFEHLYLDRFEVSIHIRSQQGMSWNKHEWSIMTHHDTSVIIISVFMDEIKSRISGISDSNVDTALRTSPNY